MALYHELQTAFGNSIGGILFENGAYTYACNNLILRVIPCIYVLLQALGICSNGVYNDAL